MTSTGHLPGLLGPLETTGRALWFLAWSVLAGATAWAWMFGPDGAGLDGEGAQVVMSLWRRALRLVWMWTAQATLLTFLVAVFASASGAAASALTGGMGLGWLVLGLGLGLLRRPLFRLANSDASSGGTVVELDRRAVTWLAGALAVGEALTVPTRSRVVEVLRVGIAATHVASAGLWLGTLALFVVILRSRSWREATVDDTSLRPLVRPVAETAARAAAVLVASGLAAAAISSPGLGRWTSEYSWILVAKAAVLVIAAAIAWRQWVVVHSPRSVARTFRSTLVEAAALLAAGTLAAMLVGVDPVPAASASPPAAAAIAPSGSTPPCIANMPRTSCDASVIEAVISHTAGGALDSTVPHLCTVDANRPRAYGYFVCLERVGQAMAATAPLSPSPALTHCQSFADPWAQQQCGSGVFAKLLSAETATSSALPDAHASDPVWPCPDVTDTFKAPCYLSVTSRVLWLNGGNVTAAFTTCDRVESAWASECYQGMGRELTSRSGYQPGAVAQACRQAAALGPDPCIAGAVRTLVFTGHSDGAAALCRDAPPDDRVSCDAQRSSAVATL